MKGADAEWGRDGGHEAAEGGRRQGPDFGCDVRARTGRNSQQARPPGRTAGQRVEPIIRPRGARPEEACPEAGQLAVERKSREMRADHREFDFVWARARRPGLRHRHRLPARADRDAGRRVKAGAQGGEEPVPAARRDQREARRQAVGPEAARHRERAEVEQIDEVRVGPEFAVGADRVDFKFGAGDRPRVGRHHQYVDVLPQGVGGSAQLGQPVEASEGIGGSKGRGPADHRAGGRVQRLR